MEISLKAARVNANMTQIEAASKLGISRSTLQNYESYRSSPNIKMSKAIADLYGLDVDELIFFTR